ncbi:MAG: DUF3500 domain-containing protein [Verrucomicrobiae bacterium]|nr:DUF3500 domain-containing protein [Verrucomicrobiae bacterium]
MPFTNFPGASRRAFLRASLSAAALTATGSIAIPTMTSKGEKLAAELFASLKEGQRKALCFGFDHPLRSRIENNWRITKTIDQSLSADQRDLAEQIFRAIHSDEFVETAYRQFMEDNDKRFDRASVAFFGTPESGKFEFVLTGRHCTRRLDGNSVAGAAFGGPIFYGHASRSFYEKKDHKDNAFWFQAVRANQLFAMLDGKQREKALEEKGRAEQSNKTVALRGKGADLPGIGFGDLTADQKGEMNKVLADLLKPFRQEDRDEALKLINANGFDNHHIAFFKEGDIGNDRVWDVWQIEGPSMVWYFRGEPHVHTWVHIREQA